MEQKYRVIGLMSGTSLDGVDLAHCVFHLADGRWSFEIKEAETVSYSDSWKSRLASLPSKSAMEFVAADREYGDYLGQLVKKFISNNHLQVDFVSSHGHTIFHQPEKRITSQIGSGAALAAACGLPVVCDFRSLDVALGGQGAPLVPVGDRLLFSDYDYCLNLGGIANISFEKNSERIAFDICPANMPLNALAQMEGQAYDKDGALARKGYIHETLLNNLNSLDYYSLAYPKSLGREWVEDKFFPLLNTNSLSIADRLCTCCEHIAIQIANVIKSNGDTGKLYITGGGAFNKFLVERISEHLSSQIMLPEAKLVNYKEALIFAFLGVLRWRGENNCLKSVTGASKDSCSGAVYSC